MAEAIARYDAADVIEPHSAGVSPLGHIADLTTQTLVKNGYSAAGLTSDALTKESADAASSRNWGKSKIGSCRIPMAKTPIRTKEFSKASNDASTSWRKG
jgi:hypothetical protein